MPHVHAPGLVLRLDPLTLASNGATYTGDNDTPWPRQMYFVCIESGPTDALWLPLFPGPGPGRKGIAASAKTGNTRWTKNSSFYDSTQLCRIGHKAIQQAATVAYDDSTPKAPNRMAVAQLPPRSEFPADSEFHPLSGNAAID
jgi:hypothetical protein